MSQIQHHNFYMNEKNRRRWKSECYCKMALSRLPFLLEDKQFPMNIWPWLSYLSLASECVPYWAYCSPLKEILPCGNHFAGFQVDKCLPRGIRMHFRQKTALMFVNYCDKNFTATILFFFPDPECIAKADWSGEAAYRLPSRISNLWQQYVSPNCFMFNTNPWSLYIWKSLSSGRTKIKKVRLAL